MRCAGYLPYCRGGLVKNLSKAASAKKTSPVYQPATHVIFDLDGVVLDTEKVYFEVFREIASKYQKVYTLDTMRSHEGKRTISGFEHVVNELLLPITPKELERQFDGLLTKKIGGVTLMPGIEKLTAHFNEKKVPMAVVTSGSDPWFTMKTEKYLKFFQIFEHVLVAGNEHDAVRRRKPHGDIYVVACKRFPRKPPCEECLVFENSPHGVKAALKAGMQVVMIPHRILDAKHTREATLVISSLAEFKPELFGLPPFEK